MPFRNPFLSPLGERVARGGGFISRRGSGEGVASPRPTRSDRIWLLFLPMWTYLLGPFLSLLPANWRAKLPWAESIRWRRAAFLSGALEVIASIYGLAIWYSYSVTHHARLQLDLVLHAHPDLHLRPEQLGLLGFVLVALNPVTLVILWFWFEGAVRLFGAAFTEETIGTLPLWILDRSYRAFKQRKENRLRPPLVTDEVFWHKDGRVEVLRVMSCRPKSTWKNRATIRIKDEFFRVENSITGSGPRPFGYQLRRLQPGEIIRAPENYDPKIAPYDTREENLLVLISRSVRRS